MRTFKYRARNQTGKIVEGTVSAQDTNDAHQKLESLRLLPVELALASGAIKRQSIIIGGHVKDQELIVFTRQLATLLKAGVPVLQALQALRKQTENPILSHALEEIEKNVTGGAKLSEAMAEFPKIFSQEYTSIVVSGESGADLVEVLYRMADWMEHEFETRTEISTAMRYPIMVLLSMILAFVVLMLFVIPKFAEFYGRMKVDLPLPTRIMIGSNEFINDNWVILLAALLAIIIAAPMSLKLPSVRLWWDRFKLKAPIVGPIYRKMIMSRFSRIMAMLVRNGVPVIKALEMAPTVVNNMHLKLNAAEARRVIQGGGSVFEGFESAKIFPPIMTQLIAIGEKTGSLDEMLDFVVAQYEMDIKYELRTLNSTIEPVVTIILGVGVLFLALAIYLPIWNLHSAYEGTSKQKPGITSPSDVGL